MSEDDKGSGYRKLWWVVPLVLFLYVISIGPVAAYVGNDEPPGLLTTFYAPLLWLYEHSTLAQRFFDWWVLEVWGAGR